MSRVLLDTHVLLWVLTDDDRREEASNRLGDNAASRTSGITEADAAMAVIAGHLDQSIVTGHDPAGGKGRGVVQRYPNQA